MKKIITIGLIVLLTLSMVSCSSKNTLSKVKQDKVLVMGTSADFPPYESHQVINGKDTIVGFDVDIANAVAKQIGVPLKITDMDFKGLIGAVNSGKIDMVVAGMTPTPDRVKSVDFSDLYYNGKQVLVVKDDSTISKFSDLNGKRIEAQLGTTSEEAAKKIKNAQYKAIDKVTTEIEELKTGRSDGFVVEATVASAYLKANPDLKEVQMKELATAEGSAIAVKKGDSSKELLTQINKAIKSLKDSGEYDKLISKWFK